MDRKQNSGAEILRYLSTGMMTKGLYLQKNLNDSITPRNHLIELPTDVQFTFPSIPESAETFELTNKKVSEKFEIVLNNAGKSLATMFHTKLSEMFSERSREIEMLKKSTDAYFKSWSYKELKIAKFVPISSFTLSNGYHCNLSKYARQRLCNIEASFNRTGSNDMFIKDCHDFFTEFGSHYFVGVYHFGGRRSHSVVREVQIEKQGLEKKIPYTFDTVTESYNTFGGAVENVDFSEWKISLIENPLKWYVIDKDASSAMNYRAVWNLIESDRSELRDALQNAWIKLTDLTKDPSIDGITFLIDTEIDLLKKKLENDIFLYDYIGKMSEKTNGETTVSDLFNQMKRSKLNNESPEREINDEEDIDSMVSLLRKESLNTNKLEEDFSSTSVETERLVFDDSSSDDTDLVDSSNEEDEENLLITFSCHPNCLDCNVCKDCPACQSLLR